MLNKQTVTFLLGIIFLNSVYYIKRGDL